MYFDDLLGGVLFCGTFPTSEGQSGRRPGGCRADFDVRGQVPEQRKAVVTYPSRPSPSGQPAAASEAGKNGEHKDDDPWMRTLSSEAAKRPTGKPPSRRDLNLTQGM